MMDSMEVRTETTIRVAKRLRLFCGLICIVGQFTGIVFMVCGGVTEGIREILWIGAWFAGGIASLLLLIIATAKTAEQRGTAGAAGQHNSGVGEAQHSSQQKRGGLVAHNSGSIVQTSSARGAAVVAGRMMTPLQIQVAPALSGLNASSLTPHSMNNSTGTTTHGSSSGVTPNGRMSAAPAELPAFLTLPSNNTSSTAATTNNSYVPPPTSYVDFKLAPTRSNGHIVIVNNPSANSPGSTSSGSQTLRPILSNNP